MSNAPTKEQLQSLKLVAFDIDGVFTDGRFYLADDGTESKAFHTQDGYGIRCLIRSGRQVAVISGRRSGAVERRMNELGVQHVVLGCSDKVAAFDKLVDGIGADLAETAYTGDDIPDLPLLNHAGIAFAVGNAVADVKAACDYTTAAGGGFGAVREICDLIVGADDS